MSVKIRLARIGKKHVPFFRIVAIDTRKKRDGQNLANLGTYDPIGHKLVQFNQDGIDAWVAKGAQLTDSVKKLQKMYKEHGIGKTMVAEKAAPKKAAPVKEAPAKEAPVKEEAAAPAKEEVKAAPVKEEAKAAKTSEDK